jgi:hypothetical protein
MALLSKILLGLGAWEALSDRLSLYSDTIRRKNALPGIST